MPVVINGLDGQAAITIADGVTGVYVGSNAPGGGYTNSLVINTDFNRLYLYFGGNGAVEKLY